MKLALLFIAIMPIAMGARLNQRFIDFLSSGYDGNSISSIKFVGIAKQIVNQFGCQETELICEKTLCPNIVNKLDFGISLITTPVCIAVCGEVQVLCKLAGSGSATLGVDPYAGSGSAIV